MTKARAAMKEIGLSDMFKCGTQEYSFIKIWIESDTVSAHCGNALLKLKLN